MLIAHCQKRGRSIADTDLHADRKSLVLNLNLGEGNNCLLRGNTSYYVIRHKGGYGLYQLGFDGPGGYL